MEFNRVHEGDFFEKCKGLPDKSFSVIMADPPYYRTKGDFDKAFDTFEDWCIFIRRAKEEFHRLLADNGTIFVWGSWRKVAYVQTEFDDAFNMLNNIVWIKPDGKSKRNAPSSLVKFLPVSERCLMYEHREYTQFTGAEIQGFVNYIHNQPDLFLPIKQYMREQKASLKKQMGFTTEKQAGEYINQITGTSSVASKHYFSDSQWVFPTQQHYESLQTTGLWRREYEDLRREYEDLRREYEDLRRPFDNRGELLTDCIVWSQETHLTRHWKHPTPKPPGLIKHLIQCTTKPGSLVLDPFAGSGVVGDVCTQLGLSWIGFELDPHFAAMANKRVELLVTTHQPLCLF